MRLAAGLTLVELILAAALSVIAAAAVISGYNFLFTQTKSGIGRGDLNLRIDYALEKIRLQCLSASTIEDKFLFSADTGEEKHYFCITGEKDPYDIDISNTTNKNRYCYGIDGAGNLTLTARDTSGSNEMVEVLINARHNPAINFEYSLGSEPNYITAAITATAKDMKSVPEKRIEKKQGIRFWYVTVTK